MSSGGRKMQPGTIDPIAVMSGMVAEAEANVQRAVDEGDPASLERWRRWRDSCKSWLAGLQLANVQT